jgi:hypothetical protein
MDLTNYLGTVQDVVKLNKPILIKGNSVHEHIFEQEDRSSEISFFKRKRKRKRKKK